MKSKPATVTLVPTVLQPPITSTVSPSTSSKSAMIDTRDLSALKTHMCNMKPTYRSIMEVTNFISTSNLDPEEMAKCWLYVIKHEENKAKKKGLFYLVSEVIQLASKKKDLDLKKIFQEVMYHSLASLRGSIDSTCLKCLREGLHISIIEIL